MRFLVKTKQRPCSVEVTVKATKNTTVWIVAYDSAKPNTVYIKTFKDLLPGDKKTEVIGLPICGYFTIVEVFENTGETTLQVSLPKVKALVRKMDALSVKSKVIREFIPFALQIVYNAGDMPVYPDKLYVSAHGTFKFNYLHTIADNQITPARIDKDTRIIDGSREKFLPATVPMRFYWLAHECSHLWVNENPYDELEADLNGLIIGLGIGFPRSEAHETYLTSFEPVLQDDKTSAAALDRYQHIQDFIDQFDSLNFDHL